MSKAISGSTRPIFMIFSTNERYLREFSGFGYFFYSFRTLPWQLISGKVCEMTFIQHTGISKWIRISQFGFRGLIGTQVISK